MECIPCSRPLFALLCSILWWELSCVPLTVLRSLSQLMFNLQLLFLAHFLFCFWKKKKPHLFGTSLPFCVFLKKPVPKKLKGTQSRGVAHFGPKNKKGVLRMWCRCFYSCCLGVSLEGRAQTAKVAREGRRWCEPWCASLSWLDDPGLFVEMFLTGSVWFALDKQTKNKKKCKVGGSARWRSLGLLFDSVGAWLKEMTKCVCQQDVWLINWKTSTCPTTFLCRWRVLLVSYAPPISRYAPPISRSYISVV